MAAENLFCARVDLSTLRRSILTALGASVVACGPGVPGGMAATTPITATTGDDDSDTRTSLTTADTSDSSESVTVTMTSSDSVSDETTWECQGGMDTLTETFCQPPPGATDGSGTDGGTFGSGDDSGTSLATTSVGSASATSVGTASASASVTDTATDTDTGGGLCDAYIGDAPPIPVYYDQILESDGPYEANGQCCWDVTYTVSYPCGRPFFVDEVARVATVHPRREWADRDRPYVDEIDRETRDRLADAWLEDALAEHASIAAFARFALELLALGAPPDVLAETQRAIADELEHARLCFALASAYAGRDLGPGPLAIDGALLDEIDLAAVVVATIREGCIGETMAAMQAEVARGLAEDPAVIAALDRIAADEARHAALAWRFVDWAIKQGGRSIRDLAAEAFDRFAPTRAGNTRAPSPDLQRHGRIGASDLALLQRRTYDEVIRPCAAAVLAVPTATRSDHDHALM